jgi:hypothetical protein
MLAYSGWHGAWGESFGEFDCRVRKPEGSTAIERCENPVPERAVRGIDTAHERELDQVEEG